MESDKALKDIIEKLPLHLTHPKRKPNPDVEDKYHRFNAKIGDFDVSVDLGKNIPLDSSTDSRRRSSIDSNFVGRVYRSGTDKQKREVRVVQQYDMSFETYGRKDNTVLLQDEYSKTIGIEFGQILRDLIIALTAIHAKPSKYKKLDRDSFVVSSSRRGFIMTSMRSDTNEVTSFEDDFATLAEIVRRIFIKKIENIPRSLEKLLDHIPQCQNSAALFESLQQHPSFLNAKDRMTYAINCMLDYNDYNDGEIVLKREMIRKLELECESNEVNVKHWISSVLNDNILSKFMLPNNDYVENDVRSLFKFVRNLGVHHTDIKSTDSGRRNRNIFANRGMAGMHVEKVLPMFFDALFYAHTCCVILDYELA